MENVHPGDAHMALKISVARWVQCFLSDKVLPLPKVQNSFVSYLLVWPVLLAQMNQSINKS